ncbi:hypothetical protein [Amycolatopsis sp. cmx-4-61]|uniref:hypothetical protein n=1 Tax=Amycolatopsis sp. cmx-4-61 TaxID=2790937 RepID=UPI00397D1C2B
MTTPDRPAVEPSAHVASGARIGAGTRVWHQAQVADDVEIGTCCTLGKSCYFGSVSRIGNDVKVGNHADIFGARIDDDVMISPHALLTEDRTPRATRPDGQRQGPGDWTSTPVIVRRGATIGGGARIAGGVEIGACALVCIRGRGSARRSRARQGLRQSARAIGWVCRCAETLDDQLRCPRCARVYELAADRLIEIQPGP